MSVAVRNDHFHPLSVGMQQQFRSKLGSPRLESWWSLIPGAGGQEGMGISLLAIPPDRSPPFQMLCCELVEEQYQAEGSPFTG